jgi:hypothetical protein
VYASDDRVTTETLESHVGAHPRYSGRQDAGGEQKYEARHDQHLNRYYDDVIRQLSEPEGLLVFGPGEAKRELKARLSRDTPPPQCAVDLERRSPSLRLSRRLKNISESLAEIFVDRRTRVARLVICFVTHAEYDRYW